MLALVGKGAVVEGLENYLYLLFKQFPVGVLVNNRGAKGLHLPAVVAAAHAENHPPVGQDVGGGIVLGQAQRVPHGGDVKPAADFERLGQVGQVNAKQQQVGDALVPLPLKVMLGHPEGFIVQPVHQDGDRLGFVKNGGQVIIG